VARSASKDAGLGRNPQQNMLFPPDIEDRLGTGRYPQQPPRRSIMSTHSAMSAAKIPDMSMGSPPGR